MYEYINKMSWYLINKPFWYARTVYVTAGTASKYMYDCRCENYAAETLEIK
jgi:hypothetical protein